MPFTVLLVILIIMFMSCKGELIPNVQNLKKQCEPSATAWHPTKRIIAVGWQTGEIQVWNDQEKELYLVPDRHKAEITILHWTSNGTRILSGNSVSALYI
eukprot:GHVT01001656.1.p1 GENE.GHVT01001656.1~~GHVT01001656.1.p1  ORF type:complete len:100 (-),score=0.16 GHVT01001656.1:165-464(-)